MSQQVPQQPQQQVQPQQIGTSQTGTTQSVQPQGGAQATGGAVFQSQLYQTRNYLPEEVRVEVIRVLNQTLADATVLMSQAKYAHWNLKGRDFVGLHELFDDVAEMFEDHVDDVAERITALGGQAFGTVGQAAAICQIPHMPQNAVTGLEYVDILADNLAIHDAQLHQAIEVAQGYNDVDTVDLLNEISREVSKQLWFLEAHLQTQPISTVPISGGGGGLSAAPGDWIGGGMQQPQTGQMGQQAVTGQQQQYGPQPPVQ